MPSSFNKFMLIHNRRPLCLLASAIALAATTLLVGSESAGIPWTSLFNPKTFTDDWETTGNWQIDHEQIATLAPRPGEHGWKRFGAYLWSKRQYENFEAEFDYQLQTEGNSGFFLHVGDKNSPVDHGIEVQIYDTTEQNAAALSDHDAGGVIPGARPTRNAAHAAGQWNHYRIVARRNRLEVHLNGELVTEVDLDIGPIKSRPRKGYIGFQDEGRPLLLRNLRIRELD